MNLNEMFPIREKAKIDYGNMSRYPNRSEASEPVFVSRYESQGGKTWIEIYRDDTYGTYNVRGSHVSGSGKSYNDLIAFMVSQYIDTPSLNPVQGKELGGEVSMHNGWPYSMDDRRVQGRSSSTVQLNRRDMKAFLKQHGY